MHHYQATADPKIVSHIIELKRKVPPPIKPKPKSKTQNIENVIPKSPKPINTTATLNMTHKLIDNLVFKINKQEAILTEMKNDLDKIVNLLNSGNVY